ncbi:MAG: hypothetical protein GXO27_05545 [Chlorobi bacterium]|nr:hypothetical protein [Chlorobiota bacterium]
MIRFARPEVLYALVLVAVPLIIHLMRFRKFRTVDFPDLAFLKQVEMSSRKSRKLWEYVVLALRTAAVALAVLAFAGPRPAGTDRELPLIVVTDDSPSILYRDGKTDIKTDLLASLQEIARTRARFRLYEDGSFEEVRADEAVRLYAVGAPGPWPFDHERAWKAVAAAPGPKEVVYLTDGQHLSREAMAPALADTASRYVLVLRRPPFPRNVYADTLFVRRAPGQLEWTVRLRTAGGGGEVTVRLHGNGKLLFQRRIVTDSGRADTLRFSTPLPRERLSGRLEVEGDPFGVYDNDLYFVLPEHTTWRVLVAGDSIPSYLRSLFGGGVEADFVPSGRVPWESLDEYDLAVIVGWKPYYRMDAWRKGPPRIFIPSGDRYDEIFYREAGLTVSGRDTLTRRLERIPFRHPFFKDVFTRAERRFRAPYCKDLYRVRGGSPVLTCSGGMPYLIRKGGWLIFTGPLDAPSSDFYLSPLVIPVFYKPLWQHGGTGALYALLRPGAVWEVKAPPAERPVEIRGPGTAYVPYQERRGDRIRLFPGKQLRRPGIYAAVRDGDTLDLRAWNYDPVESRLHFPSIGPFPAHMAVTSDAAVLRSRGEGKNSLVRWAVLGVLLALLVEMWILKRKI